MNRRGFLKLFAATGAAIGAKVTGVEAAISIATGEEVKRYGDLDRHWFDFTGPTKSFVHLRGFDPMVLRLWQGSKWINLPGGISLRIASTLNPVFQREMHRMRGGGGNFELGALTRLYAETLVLDGVSHGNGEPLDQQLSPGDINRLMRQKPEMVTFVTEAARQLTSGELERKRGRRRALANADAMDAQFLIDRVALAT